MDQLPHMKCTACHECTQTVTDADIARFLPQLPDWHIVERDQVRCLERVLTFPNFVDALAFTNKVGGLAEEESHHPGLLTEWGKVTITWWTFKVRGLHRNDFIMAAKTDHLYASSSGMNR